MAALERLLQESEKYLAKSAWENRASKFTLGFGEIQEEETEVRLYPAPNYWALKVLE